MVTCPRGLAGVVSLLVAVVLGTALLVAPPAEAGTGRFRVVVEDHWSWGQFANFARRGAVGLLVPGVGPTTNRRRALAELERGAEVNANLGGVPRGPRLVLPSFVTGTPSATRLIVVVLPPKGAPLSNDRRYPIAILGGGFHGLLHSPTTRIPGLVSIVDIAPTALGRARGSLSSRPSAHPLVALHSLDRQIHSNNRLKLPAMIVLACLVAFLAVLSARAAIVAVPAALVTSVVLGATHVSNEVALMAVLVIGTLAGGVWLARVCRGDGQLLALFLAVIALHLWLLAAKPGWVALTPLGPTQNSRFWGIGNQLETLLLVPLLCGATLAGRRFGALGFGAYALLSLLLMTDNRLGSDGGGAIVLGVALAYLGARTLRLGARGFVTLLGLAATAVLALVSLNLETPGPDHLRSAFSHGAPGLLAVAENRVPLAYRPELAHWPLLLPLAVCLAATLALAIWYGRPGASRDLVVALGVAIGTSLLVNDSAAYELTGGIAALAAVARFTPSAPLLAVTQLVPQALPRHALPSEETSEN
jgi:hypothetical protein